MTFQIVIDTRARREIGEFAVYAYAVGDDYARVQMERLNRLLFVELAASPLRWGYIPLTRRPYHGYLFSAGRKAKYWLIYKVDEQALTVRVLRFWHSSRHPKTLRSLT